MTEEQNPWAGTGFGEFADTLRARTGAPLPGYQQLWEYSVQDLPGFWRAVWDHFDLDAVAAAPLADALGVSVAELVGFRPSSNGKPGPTPKLQRQIEQVSKLPRGKQKFVSDMLETVLKTAAAS